MSTKENEINSHLKLALEEIGEIKPWYDRKFKTWIFYNKLYPVEYSGNTKKEVISNYPLYLREFIKHRLQDRLSPIMEEETKGHGGKREGAGRPKGSKEEKERVYIPKDIAFWLKQPGTINHIRQLINAYRI